MNDYRDFGQTEPGLQANFNYFEMNIA